MGHVTPIVIAVIALIASIVSSAVVVYGQLHSQRRSEQREAERGLRFYKEPLISAAYELQSRIYHALGRDFLAYVREDRWGRREAALSTTAFVFAQFFGWREILRREVQLLEFETREIGRLLHEITGTLASEEFGSAFLMWSSEQRAVGEGMLGSWRDSPACVGYAEFTARRPALGNWIDALTADLVELAESGRRDERLAAVQHGLVALIEALDPEQIRYRPERLLRV